MKTILPTVFARAAIVTLFILCKKKERHKKRFSEMRKYDGEFSIRVGHVDGKEGNAHLRLL